MLLKTDPIFYSVLADSYACLLGRPLSTVSHSSSEAAAQWLYEEAPFAILVHGNAPDPFFIYGNLAAQRRFEYSWEELTALPSRFSAEPQVRQERQRFLARVAQHGYVADYRGVRISKSGKRFWIEDSVVWNLVDVQGKTIGQAAMIPKTRDL